MTLASIVLKRHGVELWRHPARFEAYLRDYAGQDGGIGDAENAVLFAVLRGGCLAALVDSDKEVSTERLNQVGEAFMRRHGIPLNSIQFAFETWAPVLGIELPQTTRGMQGWGKQAPAQRGRQAGPARPAVPLPHTRIPKSPQPLEQPPPQRPHDSSIRERETPRMPAEVRSVLNAKSFIQRLNSSLERRSPEELVPLVWEVNAWFALYFAGAFLPMLMLTFLLFGRWMSGHWVLLGYAPALYCGGLTASRFGQERYKKVILKRMKALLNF